MSFSPKVNCFTGYNGMGKTNILDAIYFLSFCKSYVQQRDALIINHDADFVMLQGKYSRRDEPEEITFSQQRGKRKLLKRNAKEYRRFSEHIGLLPLVMISPMDWELIRGSGEERRRLMDQIISQSDKSYLDALIRYTKAVESRNTLIRGGERDILLYETIEAQIIESATLIHEARQKWIAGFTPIFMDFYRTISGSAETVSLIYRSHLNELPMKELLDRNRDRDAIIGFTTKGIHRDDIDLLLGDHSMRKTGSQGQCKTYTVALRLAQYDFLKRRSGITPILLLDDIFDKLDASRVENIVSMVSDPAFGQIFITDTNRTHIDEIIGKVGNDYKIFSVNHGTISEYNAGEEDAL